jgi:hypothetical protein
VARKKKQGKRKKKMRIVARALKQDARVLHGSFYKSSRFR